MFPLFVKRLLGLIICLSILTWFSSLGRIAAPSALCNDGSYSYAQHSRGACSWHGGIAVWYGVDTDDN